MFLSMNLSLDSTTQIICICWNVEKNQRNLTFQILHLVLEFTYAKNIYFSIFFLQKYFQFQS